MKSIKNILVAMSALLSVTMASAQIKNAKTETVKIYGNCGMCEATIEKAGNLKKVAQVDWNKDTKMATLIYDSSKTSKDEILKRIALSGYDSDTFLAPDSVYNSLAGCCRYNREAKVAIATTEHDHSRNAAQPKKMTEMDNHADHDHSAVPKKEQVGENRLKPVFEKYFLLKDALVKTDGKAASMQAKELSSAIDAVNMNELPMDVHLVWMKVLTGLKADVKNIASTEDIKKQRTVFMTLSKHMYDLIKVAKYETPIFYQFCPMANGGKGANWLSKENAIKNPYYGSQMLSCGNTLETIK